MQSRLASTTLYYMSTFPSQSTQIQMFHGKRKVMLHAGSNIIPGDLLLYMEELSSLPA